MNTWQRRVRLVLAVFVAVFAVALFFALRRDRPAPPPTRVERADPTAALESRRGVSIQLKGDKEQIKVESDETFVYANGARKLKGITVTIAERAGRSFVMTGRSGEIGVDETAIKVTGEVRLTVSDGLTVTTDEAFYTAADGFVRALGPVQFERGRMRGSAIGLTYDKAADLLQLLDQVVVDIAPDENGAGGTRIVAGSSALARPERQVRFTRGVRLLRGGRALESDAAVAYLSDDEKRVKRIEMRGGSRILGGGDSAGALETMSARDMDLTYADEAEQLEQAILAGAAVVQIAGATGMRGRRIAGEWMTIGFAPDGATVTALSSRDHVRVDLPPEGDAPGRTVLASTLEASGTPATGITAAVFQENVEFREAATAQRAARVAYAGAMRLALKSNFGALESAQFSGGVRFQEGDLTATAREARYLVTSGQLELSGSDERTTRPPQVIDPKVTISGTRIQVVLDGRTISAQGNVSSVLQPTRSPARGAAPAAGGAVAPAPAAENERLPALLNQDQPAFLTSDGLVYNGASGLAVYTGQARLWQGDTTIAGERLTLDDSKGDLTSTGSARATLVMFQTNERTKDRERILTRGSGESMTYADEARRIVFTRSPSKQATLTGPQGDLTADRIDVFLIKAGDEVDRLEADGAVIIKLPQNRAASGRHLVYTASDGTYTMVGAPSQVLEQVDAGCRITTATTLTLFRSTDRIVADGNQERRTETKNGAKCSGPGFD